MMTNYKEQSRKRSEIAQVIQEQRLQKLRRKYELQRRVEDRKFENERWIDEKRKNIIGSRLRKNLDNKVQSQGRMYDPTEGLTVHWDYVLGIPKRTPFAQ